MLKKIFFFVIDVIRSFNPVDWTIVQVKRFGDTKVFKYFYNGKVFKYVGEELPCKLNRGFFAPIKNAVWNGVDVTERVRKFAGPRQDFYGKRPELAPMFYRVVDSKWVPKFRLTTGKGIRFEVTWFQEKEVEPEPGKLELTNVMGQTKVYDSVDLGGKVKLHVT
jgi:hypothetical protein